MQEEAVGNPMARDLSDLQRGDLIFWKGHVALVRDRENILHANAFHMCVAIETLQDAVARIRAGGVDVTSVRRPRLPQ
jgi:hypothetical protein